MTAVDENQNCVAFMRQTAERLDMKELNVVRSDVFRFIPMQRIKYDLIFCDPPYDSRQYDLLVSLVFGHNLLSEDGLLVVEHNKFVNFESHECFKEQRHYGKVNFTFFNAYPAR